MTSHLVRSLSSVSRVHNHQHHHHHQQQHQNNSHNYRRSTTQRLVSLSPINQNRDSSIDASLLAHENPNHCCDLASPLPLDQYKLNVDRNPHVVRRKPNEKVHYNQQIAVRYLKPPPPPRGGDIVIRELPAKQVAPAPALVVRQAPPKPCTPPPLIIREAPPCPPNPLPGKVLHVPGKVFPPPTRKVVVERLPPVPSKPQQVFIERWLPYSQPTQRIVYQPAKQPCLLPEPRNVVIQWETPDVEIRREVKHLGVVLTDPVEYVKRYGPGLVRSHQLPDIAHKYANVSGLHLAANYQPPLDVPILEGDVHALKLIDLEQVGLGRLKSSPVVSSTSHYHTAPREEHIVLSPLPYRIPTPVNSNSSAAAAINAAINSIATTAATNAATVAAPTATDASSVLVGSTGCPDEEIYLSSYNSDHLQQSTTTHHSSAQQESSQSQESGAGNTTQSILNTLSS